MGHRHLPSGRKNGPREIPPRPVELPLNEKLSRRLRSFLNRLVPNRSGNRPLDFAHAKTARLTTRLFTPRPCAAFRARRTARLHRPLETSVLATLPQHPVPVTVHHERAAALTLGIGGVQHGTFRPLSCTHSASSASGAGRAIALLTRVIQLGNRLNRKTLECSRDGGVTWPA